MSFEDYLKDKKIDSAAFKQGDIELWNDFKNQFEQMHPKSFTAQKLFLINEIRRKYILKIVEEAEITEVKKPSRPVMKKVGKPVIKKSGDEEANKPKKPQRPVMKRPKMK
ncbi:hypothetical protein [Fulvivirga lutimaris]|uniref:hypothetical protein n=1 Tax=Fulvivirga lutimaris TaxID=1819566 RepID=UPI0012BB98F6|nr:hypothetical protein [Fulvivirga lutimaris]MTI39975.1 hypothetical protein [Fulvivirga lutimaris]